MPKKYHIELRSMPPRQYPVGKYTTVEFRENCAGSCRECVKKRCVYDIFKEDYQHISTMEEPVYLYACKSCFRCVQECTKGIFSRAINPEYKELGDDYWTPNIIQSTWYQAHTGNIPVSGAGYRGPFSGEGFDSMWTDMSEIIRPTRDGIHGREYINTCIELSRRPRRLVFNDDKTLDKGVPPILEIPLPVLFQQPPYMVSNRNIQVSIARAAHRLGTMAFFHPGDIAEDLSPYTENLIPCLTPRDYGKYEKIICASRMVEIAYEAGIEDVISNLRGMKNEIFIGVRAPLKNNAPQIALELVGKGVDTIHYFADSHGKEWDVDQPRFIKDMIREIHLELVDNSLRQQINLIFSGGIAMAEHVNKSIICGADGVVVDIPLLIALECRMCRRCEKGLSCPAKLEEVKPQYGSIRISNLMGAWRNQMLEMLGAMGLREARRLRGEVGRSLWFEDLERENFAPIFGEKTIH